jgi:hypothetical protein
VAFGPGITLEALYLKSCPRWNKTRQKGFIKKDKRLQSPSTLY